MRLSQNLNDALNVQVAHELRNVVIYMQIASYFENKQLKNIASYFMKQSSDEKGHADKFLNYINDRIGGRVQIPEIEEVPTENLSDEVICNLYLETEENTTECIEAIYDLALSEKSFMDLPFLQEMLLEQNQEEKESLYFSNNYLHAKDIVLFDLLYK